jgi:hypothetical protein
MDRPQSVFQLQKALMEKVAEPPPKKTSLMDTIRSKLSREIF